MTAQTDSRGDMKTPNPTPNGTRRVPGGKPAGAC
jgi:hypothetical protein